VQEIFNATCGISIVGNQGAADCTVTFTTPEETVTWQLGYNRTDERSQLRTTIQTLEHLRRHLES